MTTKKKLATVWLDGCSGCHMSFLDLDERLLEVLDLYDLVYSPLVDVKEFPEGVDVTLVEGAVGSTGDLEKIQHIRERTKLLVSLGDCAVQGNVPGMRNKFSLEEVFDRAYRETVTQGDLIPSEVIPLLLVRERPVHEAVQVDVYVPGCPPSADTIHYLLTELAEDRVPDLSERTRFGA